MDNKEANHDLRATGCFYQQKCGKGESQPPKKKSAKGKTNNNNQSANETWNNNDEKILMWGVATSAPNPSGEGGGVGKGVLHQMKWHLCFFWTGGGRTGGSHTRPSNVLLQDFLADTRSSHSSLFLGLLPQYATTRRNEIR